MSESTSSSRPDDGRGGQSKATRPLRVAKLIPATPAATPVQPAAEGPAEGLVQPVTVSRSTDRGNNVDFDADRVTARRVRVREKKKSPLAGWHIAGIAIVGVVVVGGAVMMMLTHESRTDEPASAKVGQTTPLVPLAPAPKAPDPRLASRTAKSPPSDKSKSAKTELTDHFELKPVEPLPEQPLPTALASSDTGSSQSKEAPKPETQPTSQQSGDAASKPPGNIPAENLEYSSDYLKGRSYRREAEERAYPLQKPVVDAGLNWLARHQLADGGWAFEHRVGECRGRCPNPGELLKARVAATGFALLPFLGAGHSHLEGPYRRNVAGGLKFIMANQGPRGGMVEAGGRMYGHGIATLALCEAFGVAGQKGGAQAPPENELPSAANINLNAEQKKALALEKKLDKALQIDPRALRDAARKALLVIVNGQHPQGGWRYYPGESGDMSVVGWQIMALASGQQAGFGFDRGVKDRAFNFMRICGGDYRGDQHYGPIPTVFAYLPLGKEKHPTVTQATTAIGLLSMIYMGVHPQHPGMQVAVARLQQQGPNVGNMYYTYYANQVMYQNGGQPWEQWKQQTEKLLHDTQAKLDHTEGSWFLGGDHGSTQGGRVYCTVMALLCLEENYRHMRIFKNAIGNQGVPAAQPAGPNNAAAGPLANNGQPAAANPPVANPAGPAPQFPLAVPQPAGPAPQFPLAVPQGGGGDNLPQAGFNNTDAGQDLKPVDPAAK